MWLKTQQNRIHNNLAARLGIVLEHSQYIMGPEVFDLENELSKFVGTKYAVSCSSGTDALLMSLMAHDVQGPDYVIFTTPFTFVSTAEVIALLGARVCFVDIDPVTFNIDPMKIDEKIQMLNERNAKYGIIAVDLFGLPADYFLLKQISQLNHAFLIEDAAQSLGGDINGYRAGSLGDIGCTSFFPSKPLGCYGDGGMCFTNSDVLHEKLMSIRMHGKGSHKYDSVRVGINGRLDTIQAAILLSKLEIFEEELILRQDVANRYNSLLKDLKSIKIPQIPDKFKSAWAQYTIICESEDARNKISNKISNANIYYPKPLHLQQTFLPYCYQEGDLPISEMYSKTVLSLPMHPYVKFEEQKRIAEVIYENVDG